MSLTLRCPLLRTQMCLVVQKRTLFENREAVIQVLATNHNLSPNGILNKMRQKVWTRRYVNYRFEDESSNKFDKERLAAKFLISRGAAVKFTHSKQWYEILQGKATVLPAFSDESMRTEAIDCKGMDIITPAFDALECFSDLQYLNMSRCKHVDDYALDKVMYARDSLVYLDISGCRKITERGISSLHRLKNLKKLCLDDMTHVKELQLLTIMLEEQLPQLIIEGVDYTDLNQSVRTETTLPSYFKQSVEFQDIIIKKMIKYKQLPFFEAAKLKQEVAEDKRERARRQQQQQLEQQDLNSSNAESVSQVKQK